MQGKSLDLRMNESARAHVRSLIDRDFGGNTTAAARALGISQPMLSEFLKGSRGAGMKLLGAVSAYSRTSVDQIVGGKVEGGRMSPLDVAIAYLGRAISPEAIQRVRRRTADVDTSRYEPIDWGRELLAAQREIVDELQS